MTGSKEKRRDLLRQLPSLHRLLEDPATAPLLACYPRARVLPVLRAVLDEIRQSPEAAAPETFSSSHLAAVAHSRLASADARRLRRVINGTGIILHTNLGRAPMAEAAARRAYDAAMGYANLEYDLEQGIRGKRAPEVAESLCRLTGAEAALAVNNNAACVLLALTALASGGEVIVSRGELVEIGGGFRIPEIVLQGGAQLREVGTTNKTRLRDFEAAISPATHALLKVHPSNFRMTGFVEETSLSDLSELARERGLPLICDLGSGALREIGVADKGREMTVLDAVNAGADVVCFSGDKLLGGPQAGLAVGRVKSIQRMAAHPLMRALRCDKMTLAALQATLELYEQPERLRKELPIARMAEQSVTELEVRAQSIQDRLAGCKGLHLWRQPSEAFYGGGSLPEQRLDSVCLRLAYDGLSADALARRLRQGDPAVVGRIIDEALALDLRTIAPDETEALIQAILTALRKPNP